MPLDQLFSKDYLLNPTPTYQSKLYIPLLITFGLLLILAILTRFLKEEYKVIFNKYYYAFLTVSICGFIYLFARYEGLAWLGSRLTLLLIVSVLLLWVVYNTISTILYIPKLKKTLEVENRYEKYLPKPKRKN